MLEELFPTLYSKTFFILSSQLFFTWATTKITLAKFRSLYDWNASWITSTENERGELDLHIDSSRVKYHFYGLLLFDFLIFLLLLFWGVSQPLWISFGLFTIWSVAGGILLGLALLSVDENLGAKVLAITATIVCATFFFNLYSNVDYGFLGKGLFGALLCLCAFSIFRLFVSIPRAVERWVSGAGVIIFTLYLIYDFNKLEKLEAAGVNDWHVATRISIKIYLDIINLFIELFDAMSN
jgi:FtsH-binding integral membrane protein